MLKIRIAAALLGFFALLPAGGGAEARELVRQSFEGSGWSQSASEASIPLATDFSGVTQGSISFDLHRSGSISADERETLFELVDDDDRRVLRVKVVWSSDTDPARTALFFQGGRYGAGEYYRAGLDLWGPVAVLDRVVSLDEQVRLDLTWDDAAREYRVYVDGAEVTTRQGGIDPVTGAWFADRRDEFNDERRQDGGQPLYESRPMGDFLSRTAAVHLGYYDSPWPLSSRGVRSPLTSGEINNFVVTADVIPTPGAVPPQLSAESAAIAALQHDGAQVAGFSDKLVAGDLLTVTLEGTPGAEASFDVMRLSDRRGAIALSWAGWGVYLEEITFFEDDQVDLSEVEEYRVYTGTEALGDITLETEAAEILEVEEQSVLLEGLEIETPYSVAVMALMDDDTLRPVIAPVQSVPMVEEAELPGTYTGTWTVGSRDRYPEAVIAGRVVSGDSVTTLAGDEVLEIDASLNVAVEVSERELKADEESTAEIEVTVTDANDNPVSGHEVRFVLATTSQYTGVVGGGSFTNEVGGTLSRDFWGETDLFGQVTATYTAGFAAKTAIIVARDMTSSDVGAGYVKTYIEATAELELEAVQEVAGKALGYTITVTSSDEWLTADGESEARITALVAQNGIPVEGHRVSFRVSSGTGSIRTVDDETGSDGKARAVYTAGRKIGIVLITAVDQTVGISGSVQIELRSDAPAKIAITLTPDLLPADGRSTADIEVVVTDINDNPNEGVEVEYEVDIGSGRLRNIDEVTDRRGESVAEYVAGTVPGRVGIKVTVRSTEPTEDEMAEARALATAVKDYDFF